MICASRLVAIANTWTEIGPCNFHLRELAAKIKEGVRAAGGTPMEFNTIAVNDGITMGTEGMKASLISREVIADSIELVAGGHMFDAVVALSSCDKTIPGTVMALARLDVPALMLYGGSIAPGQFHGHSVSIQDVFEAVGAHAKGMMSDAELEGHGRPRLSRSGRLWRAVHRQHHGHRLRVPGDFAAGQQQRAGHGRASNAQAAYDAGVQVMNLLQQDIRPSRILTLAAFKNAAASVSASGGSSNAVLHLLALASEVGVPFHAGRPGPYFRQLPLICDLKPGGRYMAADYFAAGGSRLLAKRLAEMGVLNRPA